MDRYFCLVEEVELLIVSFLLHFFFERQNYLKTEGISFHW